MKRGNSNIAMLLATFITAIIMAVIVSLATTEEAEYIDEYKIYTVMPNDTLWSIAEDIESDKDIREVIFLIKQDNGLADYSINAWQELKIREEY